MRYGLIKKKDSEKKHKAALYPKTRFPHGYKISAPGDMIQLDTKRIMLCGGRKYHQFTAIDVLSKKRVLAVYPSLSSRNGLDFLKMTLKELPFKIKAIQTDNSSEFLKHFDCFCKQRKLPHFFTYPRHPKQNAYVESSHSADEREFYEQGVITSNLALMRTRIKEREQVWNELRPHQALGYRTPDEYLRYFKSKGRIPTKEFITLQT